GLAACSPAAVVGVAPGCSVAYAPSIPRPSVIARAAAPQVAMNFEKIIIASQFDLAKREDASEVHMNTQSQKLAHVATAPNRTPGSFSGQPSPTPEQTLPPRECSAANSLSPQSQRQYGK